MQGGYAFLINAFNHLQLTMKDPNASIGALFNNRSQTYNPKHTLQGMHLRDMCPTVRVHYLMEYAINLVISCQLCKATHTLH